uniref:Transmembrane protein n=1 Tax=Schizaphis graminum TaxID=13262 RepID=A0A2S2N8F2_SCHGA
MSLAGREKRLLFTTAIVVGALLVAFVSDVDSRSQYKDKPEESDKSQTPPVHKDFKTTRKNSFLHSAWVIIAILLTIVLSAIAVYYWILFYPIMCKKERKYDVMQMSAKP